MALYEIMQFTVYKRLMVGRDLTQARPPKIRGFPRITQRESVGLQFCKRRGQGDIKDDKDLNDLSGLAAKSLWSFTSLILNYDSPCLANLSRNVEGFIPNDCAAAVLFPPES